MTHPRSQNCGVVKGIVVLRTDGKEIMIEDWSNRWERYLFCFFSASDPSDCLTNEATAADHGHDSGLEHIFRKFQDLIVVEIQRSLQNF